MAARRRQKELRAWSIGEPERLGRLQTDADGERVMDGFGEDKKKSPVSKLVKKIAARWFVVREASGALSLPQPRWASSYLRVPMTSRELRRGR